MQVRQFEPWVWVMADPAIWVIRWYFIPQPGAIAQINKFLCDLPLPGRRYFSLPISYCFCIEFWGFWLNLGGDDCPRPWGKQFQVETFMFYFLWRSHHPKHRLHKLPWEWCLLELYTCEVKHLWFYLSGLGGEQKRPSHLSLTVLHLC